MKTFSYPRMFTFSAGVLLLALAIGMFISNEANAGFVPLRDPFLAVSMPVLFWIVGTAELVIGLICLFGRGTETKLAMVLWLALNFLAYQLALLWFVGPRSFNGYLGTLGDAFDVSSNTAHQTLEIVFYYLLIGSLTLLIWCSLPKTTAEKDDCQKISCQFCGGKIKFSVINMGRQIACPHCASIIALQESTNLKMACFFCKEHIEFPHYALGRKISCPHCKMGITLMKTK